MKWRTATGCEARWEVRDQLCMFHNIILGERVIRNPLKSEGPIIPLVKWCYSAGKLVSGVAPAIVQWATMWPRSRAKCLPDPQEQQQGMFSISLWSGRDEHWTQEDSLANLNFKGGAWVSRSLRCILSSCRPKIILLPTRTIFSPSHSLLGFITETEAATETQNGKTETADFLVERIFFLWIIPGTYGKVRLGKNRR